jgi:hypothetical protein
MANGVKERTLRSDRLDLLSIPPSFTNLIRFDYQCPTPPSSPLLYHSIPSKVNNLLLQKMASSNRRLLSIMMALILGVLLVRMEVMCVERTQNMYCNVAIDNAFPNDPRYSIIFDNN